MSVALKYAHTQLSEQEYLALEQQADIRYECMDGEAYAMVGGSLKHGSLVMNLSREIANHLKGKPCRVFAESIKVKIANQKHKTTSYFYPDVVVDCSIEKAQNNMLTTPVLIVEVLSPATHKYDETTKFERYKQIATLQEYVLIEQNSVKIEVQRRRKKWQTEKYFLGDEMTFESIGLTIAVVDLYDQIDNEEMQNWLAQCKNDKV